MQGRLPTPPALWLRCALVIVASVALAWLGGGRMLAADASADGAKDKRWIQVTPNAVLPVRIGDRWGVLRPDGSTLLSPIYSSITLLDASRNPSADFYVGQAANSRVDWRNEAWSDLDAGEPLIPPVVFIVARQPGADRNAPLESVVFTVDGRRLFAFQGWFERWVSATGVLDRHLVPRPPFDPWLPDPAAGEGPMARVRLMPGAAYAGVEVVPVVPPKSPVSPAAPAAPSAAAERPPLVAAYRPLDKQTQFQWQEQVGRERGIADLTSYGSGYLMPDDGTPPYLCLLAKRGRPFLVAHQAAKKLKQVAREPYVRAVDSAPWTYQVGDPPRTVRLACSAKYFAIAVDRHVALYSEACELLAEADLPPFEDLRFTRDGEYLYLSTKVDQAQSEGQLLTMQGVLLEPQVRINPKAGRLSLPSLDDLYGPAYIAHSDKGVGLYRPDLQRWVVEPTAKEIYRTTDRQFFRVLDADQKVRIVNERGALELYSERSCADYLSPGVNGGEALVIHFDRLGGFRPTLKVGDIEPITDTWSNGRIATFSTRYLAFGVSRGQADTPRFSYRIYDRVRKQWLGIDTQSVNRVSPEILYVESLDGDVQLYLMADGTVISARQKTP